MTKTYFLERNQVHSKILETEKSLSNKLDKVEKALSKDSMVVDGNSLHYLIELFKPENAFEHSFYGLIGKSLIQAESLAGGSAQTGIKFLLPFIRNFVKNERINNLPSSLLETEYDLFLKEAWTSILRNSKPATQKDVEEVIASFCRNKNLETVVSKAIELAGLEGKIYVEDGLQDCFVVEKKTGYSFKVHTFKIFFGPGGIWEEQNVKVLLIDGLIEKVSEIDHLLKASFGVKQPLIIVAKGFSEEVIATLKINHDKDLFRILPVQIESNLSSINLLSDLASVSDSDVVSSLKGDLISCVDWDGLKTVQKIRCSIGSLTIEEDKTKNRVISQVKSLLDKRQNNLFNEDIVTLLDERIKCLSSSTVAIRLPNTTAIQNQTCRVSIDTTLRNLKVVLDSGFINLKDFKDGLVDIPASDTNKCLLKSLSDIDEDLTKINIPVLTLQLIYKICMRQALLFVTSSGAILAEE
jgi:hypothetical protein